MKISLSKENRTRSKARLLAAMAIAAFTAVSCQNSEKIESPTVWLTPSTVALKNAIKVATRSIALASGDATASGDPTASGNATFWHLTEDQTTLKAFAFWAYGDGEKDPVKASFKYSETEGKWNGRIGLKPGNKYDVFAYSGDGTPSMASGDAPMKITRIPVVTAGDPLISVASYAKNAKNDEDPFYTDLTPGSFTTDLITLPDVQSGESFDDWKISFAMDHLYAGVVFNFRVPESDKIERVFKLKKVEVTSATPAYIDATVTFGGTTGISNLLFDNPENATTGLGCKATVFTDSEGFELTATAKEITASFLPGNNNGVEVAGLTMTSTYDVYDRADKLVREDCTATNYIKFETNMPTPRGARRTYNVSIIPTYLCQMSDNDPSSPQQCSQ